MYSGRTVCFDKQSQRGTDARDFARLIAILAIVLSCVLEIANREFVHGDPEWISGLPDEPPGNCLVVAMLYGQRDVAGRCWTEIDHLAIEAIPVFIIHGRDDKVVPLAENSAALEDVYKSKDVGRLIEVIKVDGQGHSFWPGYFHCQELVDFLIDKARSQ